MRKISLLIFSALIALISINTTVSALDETPLYRGVLQIRSYIHDPASGLYILSSYGSSVSLGDGRLVTNAHVVVNPDTDEPYGKYEVCQSFLFEKEPKCLSAGILTAYDTDNDLALLKLKNPKELPKIALSDEQRLQIGSPLIIYGYPSIGGSTITRTAGRVAGFDFPYYKIDGIIDRGNSGGGAFSLSGKLLGIPSRLIADNAALGYMIPMGTIRSFLSGKTSGYTRYIGPSDDDFFRFLETKYQQRENAYLLKNNLFRALNLKKYGVKFIKNSLTNAQGSQVLLSFLYERRNIGFALTCGNIAGSTDTLPYYKTDNDPNIEEEVSTRSRYYMTSRYTQKDLASYVIYDTRSPCVLVPYAPINSRDKGVLAELEKFFDEGITLASKFDTSGGFHGSLFSIDTLPKNMIMSEFPDYSGDSSTNIYFRNSLGQGSTASVARKEFDRLKDLFSTLFPDDTQREKATSLSEISSFYQRALSDGEFMLSGSTASGDPYYLSYIQSKSPEKGKVYSAVGANIITEYTGRYRVIQMQWRDYSPWLDQSELDTIKSFLTALHLKNRK